MHSSFMLKYAKYANTYSVHNLIFPSKYHEVFICKSC